MFTVFYNTASIAQLIVFLPNEIQKLFVVRVPDRILDISFVSVAINCIRSYQGIFGINVSVTLRCQFPFVLVSASYLMIHFSSSAALKFFFASPRGTFIDISFIVGPPVLPMFANSSAVSFPFTPTCDGIHCMWKVMFLFMFAKSRNQFS